MGKNADVGWREGPRDAGLEGEVGPLEEETVLDREKGLVGKLEGGAPVGLSGEGANEGEEAVRGGRCCCCC